MQETDISHWPGDPVISDAAKLFIAWDSSTINKPKAESNLDISKALAVIAQRIGDDLKIISVQRNEEGSAWMVLANT